MGLKYVLGATLCSGVCFAGILPHTVLLEKYKQLKGRYLPNQTEKPVREEIKQKFEEVLCDLHVKEKQKQNIRLFNVFDYDMFHAGTVLFKYGALVGIPINFEYDSTDEVNRNIIYFKDKPIDWTTQTAEDFLDAVVLSENAQKFAMAREVLYLQENEPLCRTVLMLLHSVTAVAIYTVFTYRAQLKNKTPSFRIFYGLGYTIASIAILIGILDIMRCEFDTNVDKTLSQLGSKYVQGGKEFYEKLQKRNAALRTLLGKDGEAYYTITGNENTILRQKRIPISQRKTFFESKLENVHELV